MPKRYCLLLIVSLFLYGLSFASFTPADAFDAEIESIYANMDSNLSDHAKLHKISQSFLGKPYVLGPLGEGKTGRYDQHPLYRLDQFDCQTYVETVLSLTYAKSLAEFKTVMNHIRYENKKPIFTERNHFMSTDWNKVNAKKGYIIDITESIKNKKHQSVALLANTVIDKPNWYQHLKKESIQINDTRLIHQRLLELHREAKHMKVIPISTPYLPLTALFNKEGKANTFLFSQIPNGSVIEIVRPDWTLKDKIGTNLNVSHVGLAFREHNTLMFRHASTTDKKVVSLPLKTYLARYLNSPTIKGINVQRIIFK